MVCPHIAGTRLPYARVICLLKFLAQIRPEQTFHLKLIVMAYNSQACYIDYETFKRAIAVTIGMVNDFSGQQQFGGSIHPL
jgi:hypothetical protein